MPEISQEELDKYKANEESLTKLAAKNAEILAEKKAEKERADKLAQEKADAETQRLKETGDYKAIVEKIENDNKLLKEQSEIKEKARILEIKKGAVSLELDKLGVIAERKAFLMASTNFEDLQYVEAGNIILGADTKAKSIQSMAPEMFGRRSNHIPNGGNNGGTPPPAEMTDEWFNALSVEDQAKNRTAYLNSKGAKIRTRN